jgi:hypothetical protein
MTLAACGRPIDRYCDMRLKPGNLQVVPLEITPRIEQRYGVAALDRLSEHSASEITLGLTRAKSLAKVQIELHGLKVPGGVCVRPQVSMQVGYADVLVDLATELQPNTCPYNQVLGHEMRHVGVYRSFLATVQPEMVRLLNERLPAPRIYRFGSMAEAGEYFQNAQDQWMSPMAISALDEVASEQAEVDTPAEYQRLSNACGAEILPLQSLHP